MSEPEQLQPRIIGLEMEYMSGYYEKQSKKVNIQPTDQVSKLFRPIDGVPSFASNERAKNVWLGNGGRYYADVHNTLEYATPECLSFDDVVIYDQAGEMYLSGQMERAVEDGVFARIQSNKRVIDHAPDPNSNGAHENYSMHAPTYYEVLDGAEKTFQLATFFATRAIFTGAGSVDHRGRFHVTQKFQTLDAVISSNTTKNKPLVQTRNEPHAKDDSDIRRLHVVSGDANVSPWATWMKVGTTSLVLSLFEHGMFPADVALCDPLSAAHQIDYDTSLTTKFSLENDTKETALSIQQKILDAVREMAGRYQLQDQDYEVIEEWQQVLDDLQVEQERCRDRIDWVARKFCASKLLDLETSSAKEEKRRVQKLKKRDLGYDMIFPSPGLGLVARRKDNPINGGFRRMPSIEAVGNAQSIPPEDTRARVRGAAIRFLAEGRFLTNQMIDWVTIGASGKQMHIYDPFDSHLGRFQNWAERF